MRMTSARFVLPLLLAAISAPTAALELRAPPPGPVGCIQTKLSFTAPRRGYHLITDEVNEVLGNQLHQFQHGMCNLFVQHMECSLTINENSDPTVRDGRGYGAEDVPSEPDLLGLTVSIPITRGALALGPWQGIYLCEHRITAEGDMPRPSVIVITAHGQFATMVR